jgi:hypothetical protein
MRQIAGIAAFISLSLGSLLPADCCRAAQRAKAITADLASGQLRPETFLDDHCRSACCGALQTTQPTQPAGELPCRCQLQPRDSQLFLTAPRLTVAPDDTVMTAAVDGVDLVAFQQPPITFVPGTGPPPRPVRVLYGVWRN